MTIEQTVTTAMSNAGYSGYRQYADPVITDLVNREQQIVGRLIEFAENSDLDVAQVRSALAECGMHMPPEPQEPESAAVSNDLVADGTLGSDALTATLGRIEAALTGLTEFARRNGYTG